ncbi:ATP-binding protein [Streptomyces camponoticapitis]|uniref:ATP-binding protein n=2 Tax=Streptomyces camponoticapitis TaxID=1616125 RepID=A0ABQ2ES49_9ACTN|nr:ATP-binding protein [Streptomyces camponoticapitis]
MPLARMSARALRERSPADLVAHLTEQYRLLLLQDPSSSERGAWKNSLPALAEVLCDAGLDEVEVLIEQKLPLTSLRADAVLAGSHPETGLPSYVIVELKQWSEARLVPDSEDLCLVPKIGNHAALHPVAQVRRYCDYLQDFTNLLNDCQEGVTGVAYLHNAEDLDVDQLFRLPDAKAQLFTKTTRGELIRYLQTRLSSLNGALEADALLESPIAPGRQLMRAASYEITHGGKFLLIDEQQVAASLVKRAASAARRADQKEVIVVSGGPGSGKSLIALNLMNHFSMHGRPVVHATGSRSFTTTLRHVVGEKNSKLPKLFRYFFDFTAAEQNGLDVLICDEAHRIRRHSGKESAPDTFRPGRSQVEELIDAARVPVFLLDEHQVVRPGEMGSVKTIDQAAHARGCIVRHVNLNDQFRCGGSRAYENWVLRLLGLEPGGPVPWQPDKNFELLVADTPQEMETHLRFQQEAGYTARMTAGFCWRWSSPRSDGSLVDDVVIGNWRRPWNLKSERSVGGVPASSLWATEPGGIGQIGCIYTAQGFEYAWNGTILGPDLVWRDNGWRARKAASRDGSLKDAEPEEFELLARNSYKVLLTRGLAGTVLYSTDPETHAMLRGLVPGRVTQ